MHAISLSFFLSFCLSVCLSSDYYKCLTTVKTSVAVTYLLLLLRSNDNRPVSQCVYYSTPVASSVFAVGNLCLPPEWMIYKLKLNYLRYLERERERGALKWVAVTATAWKNRVVVQYRSESTDSNSSNSEDTLSAVPSFLLLLTFQDLFFLLVSYYLSTAYLLAN